MDALVVGLIVFVLVVLFLGTGTWIFSGLLLASAAALYLILDFPPHRIGVIMKGITWRTISTWEVAAIPLFIWMGEIIFRTDISERLFRGLVPIVDRVPGRLLHTNVAGCTLFAAVCGSTAATTATVGQITTSALSERGYDVDLSVGSLAGAGSLGLMIPPSIVMIVYGLLAEVSVAKLFVAGVLPGLLIAALYSGFIAIRCSFVPSLAPASGHTYAWRDRLKGAWLLTPVIVLAFLVLGGIYSGVATPSEAAAVGVTATLVVIAAMGQFKWSILIESAFGAIRTSCMVCTLLIAATFLSTAMGYLHVPQEIAAAIAKANLPPYGLILILVLFYLLLGMFLEGISITVMTLPITLPLILQAGFDPIWFGVFLVIMIELAAITPPIGFNLFVLQSLTGHSIGRVAWASAPFFVLMCIATVIITAFPEIALWLPGLMR